MLIDLEFAKTVINAIINKLRNIKSDVDAVKSDVDTVKSDVGAVKSDVDAVKSDVYDIYVNVDGITDGLRTHSIKEAINFPMNLKVYAGTKALEVDGNLTEGNYGSLVIDTLPVFHCYLSESATYSLLVKINDEEISSSITEVSNNHLKIKTDVYGELFFNAGSSQVGINSPISDGSRLYVSLVYSQDYSGVTLLTDSDITNGGTNYNNIENKITTDKNVSLYLWKILPNLKYTFIKDIAIDNDSTSIIIKSSDIDNIALSDTKTIESRTLFKLGVLPNNFSVMFESCGETSAMPLKNIDDMVLFTWGEIPGTFKIITYRSYVSKAHTLIKNFDTFEANTTYLIWIRSSIVFAFKAETLTEDGLIIS